MRRFHSNMRSLIIFVLLCGLVLLLSSSIELINFGLLGLVHLYVILIYLCTFSISFLILILVQLVVSVLWLVVVVHYLLILVDEILNFEMVALLHP